MHTSWNTWRGTRIPSNGLVVRDGAGVLLVDTAWGEAPTDALVDWIERALRLRVTRVLVTHAHDDRLGGGPALARRKIPFLGHAATVAAASARGALAPGSLGTLARGASVRVGPVDVFFPGGGHTADNIVVWVRGARILHGGCAVKSADSRDLGNVADADVASWPAAIRRVQRRFRTARIVVPGHGEPGGAALLAHTLALLAAREANP